MCFVAALPALASLGSTILGGGAAATGAAAATAGSSLFSTLGTIATIGSGAIGAYSSIQSGNAAAAAAEATAKQQDAAAKQTLIQGEEESDRQRRAGAVMMAQQRVAQAANGIDASGTTAIEMLNDTKAAIEDDAFAIRQNAQRSAQGLSQQAANSLTEGQNAKREGFWGGMGTILSTGARVGEKYSQWARSRAGQGSYS